MRSTPRSRTASREADDDSHLNVGEKLRNLRKARSLSLQELADRSGISIGQISQIERGLSSPSVRTLVSLCDAVGCTIGALFDRSSPAISGESKWIVRVAERKHYGDDSKNFRKFLLSPDEAKHQIYLIEFDALTSSGAESHNYSGHSSGVLLEGRFDLEIGGERHLLGPGDAFFIPPGKPRRYSNPGPLEAKIIWFISAPRNLPGDAGGKPRKAAVRRNGGKIVRLGPSVDESADKRSAKRRQVRRRHRVEHS